MTEQQTPKPEWSDLIVLADEIDRSGMTTAVEQQAVSSLLRKCAAALHAAREREQAQQQEIARVTAQRDADRKSALANYAKFERAEQEITRLRGALIKVRAHTGYLNPTLELLAGLLQSVERIVDAALAEAASPPQKREPSCHACGGPIELGEPIAIYHEQCDRNHRS